MKRRILYFVIGMHALALCVALLVKPEISHQILTPIRVSTYTYEPPPPKQRVITKSPSVVKKPQPPKKKKPPPPKARDVLSKVQKNLQKIDTKTKPKTISYATLMMQRLQTALSLPEEGDVKLQLTLNADGKVLQLTILQSQSDRNSEYLSQVLPTLIFPGFTGDLQGRKQHTFTLTVCHDF